jgi:hypothetical protein
MATMAIYAQCLPRHRHGEFLRFLRVIDRQIPKGGTTCSARCSPAV